MKNVKKKEKEKDLLDTVVVVVVKYELFKY